MKKIPITQKSGQIWNLEIPDFYERIPLPFFDEWVKALDSGNFSQASGRLHEIGTDSYCCLGVLSKIQGRLTNAGYDSDEKNAVARYVLAKDNPCFPVFGSDGKFPEKVVLKNTEESCSIDNLPAMNDKDFSFSEISKVIKEIWKSDKDS